MAGLMANAGSVASLWCPDWLPVVAFLFLSGGIQV